MSAPDSKLDRELPADLKGYSMKQVSQNLGVSKGHILNEIKRGKLVVHKMGRRVIILDVDLRKYLGSLEAH